MRSPIPKDNGTAASRVFAAGQPHLPVSLRCEGQAGARPSQQKEVQVVSSTCLWHCELMRTTMEPSSHPQAWPQWAMTAWQGPRGYPTRRTALAGSPQAEKPSPPRAPQAEASCSSSLAAPSVYRKVQKAVIMAVQLSGPRRCLPQAGSAQAEQIRGAYCPSWRVSFCSQASPNLRHHQHLHPC